MKEMDLSLFSMIVQIIIRTLQAVVILLCSIVRYLSIYIATISGRSHTSFQTCSFDVGDVGSSSSSFLAPGTPLSMFSAVGYTVCIQLESTAGNNTFFAPRQICDGPQQPS